VVSIRKKTPLLKNGKPTLCKDVVGTLADLMKYPMERVMDVAALPAPKAAQAKKVVKKAAKKAVKAVKKVAKKIAKKVKAKRK